MSSKFRNRRYNRPVNISQEYTDYLLRNITGISSLKPEIVSFNPKISKAANPKTGESWAHSSFFIFLTHLAPFILSCSQISFKYPIIIFELIMKNEEFIKSFVRLKPILMDEMPAITSTDHDVIINKTK